MEAKSGLMLPVSALQMCEASMPAGELVSPGFSPRGKLGFFTCCEVTEEESDAASTVADSCDDWSSAVCSEEQEDGELFPCVQIVKNTFISIVPESMRCGGARRRTRSEPRSARYVGLAESMEQVRIASPSAASRISWAEMSEEELDDICC